MSSSRIEETHESIYMETIETGGVTIRTYGTVNPKIANNIEPPKINKEPLGAAVPRVNKEPLGAAVPRVNKEPLGAAVVGVNKEPIAGVKPNIPTSTSSQNIEPAAVTRLRDTGLGSFTKRSSEGISPYSMKSTEGILPYKKKESRVITYDQLYDENVKFKANRYIGKLTDCFNYDGSLIYLKTTLRIFNVDKNANLDKLDVEVKFEFKSPNIVGFENKEIIIIQNFTKGRYSPSECSITYDNIFPPTFFLCQKLLCNYLAVKMRVNIKGATVDHSLYITEYIDYYRNLPFNYENKLLVQQTYGNSANLNVYFQNKLYYNLSPDQLGMIEDIEMFECKEIEIKRKEVWYNSELEAQLNVEIIKSLSSQYGYGNDFNEFDLMDQKYSNFRNYKLEKHEDPKKSEPANKHMKINNTRNKPVLPSKTGPQINDAKKVEPVLINNIPPLVCDKPNPTKIPTAQPANSSLDTSKK